MNTPYGAYAPDDFASVDGLAGSDDTLTGTSGQDTLDGGRGDDVIDGGQGADLMLGGAGADTLVWNPGGGNDTVDGGAGRDTLAFNGSNIGEVILLQNDVGGHAVLTRNIANIVMDVDNIERVAFRALGGADVFSIGDLGQTDIRQVDIDLGGSSGGGDGSADLVGVGGDSTNDRIVLTNKDGAVTVAGVGVGLTITNGEAADRLAASTGSGDDVVDISRLDAGIGVKFDGGEGVDTLVTDGTSGDDSIALFGSRGQGGLPDGFDVSINTLTSHADLIGVETISVDAGDGDDNVDGRGLVSNSTLVVEGGRGADTITGSTGADTLDGGAGDDRIDGGVAADLMRGGAGADTLVWNPGGGSDTVDGGTGQDTVVFNGSNIGEEIGLTAGLDGHATLTRNVANIVMDVNNVEHVSFATVGGADRVTIGDLRATDIRQVDVNLAANGGGGDSAADVVVAGGSALADRIVLTNVAGTVNVSGVGVGLAITGADAPDRFAADLGAGDDRVDISHLDGGIGLAFDGGEGQDTLTANGTDGADSFQLVGARGQNGAADGMDIVTNGAVSHVDSLGVETISIDAGAGDDNIDARSLSSNSTVAIDGGRGNDTLSGSATVDILDGGAGDDRIDGNGGADLMRGGAGDDTLLGNPGGGSDTVDGGSGHDELQFNGSNIGEEISLTAGVDGHAVLTRNIAAINMDVNNIEHVSFRALGGADHFTFGDLRSTDIRQVDVNLAQFDGAGDAAADTLSFTAGKLAGHLDVQVAGFEAHGANPSGDMIILNGFADHSFADAVAAHHIFQAGTDVTSADGTGLVVTLQNTTLAGLGASDFLFG